MSNEENKHSYDDIMDFPYPFQLKHPRMRKQDRAAQFSSFAALSGFHSAICETARLTDQQLDLDEEGVKHLNAKLQVLRDHLSSRPLITITYFLPDGRKDGGAYLTVSEHVRRIDEYEKTIATTTGLVIPIGDIQGLEGEIFGCLEIMDG